MYRVQITGTNSKGKKTYDREEEFYNDASMKRVLGNEIAKKLLSDGRADEFNEDEKVYYVYTLLGN